MKHKSKIDIAVLLVFFCREKQVKQVFEAIKMARPSKLFLYQDGPRKDHPDDIEKILRCREIVEDIDWECEVHRLYQNENMGCDPSGHISHNWMLSKAGMGIILEDDTIPSQSFFPYCKELLERYKNDNRIHRICGMNNVEYSDEVKESYFFTRQGAIWGWATWARTMEIQDTSYSFLEDEYYLKNMQKNYYSKNKFKSMIALIKKRKKMKVDFFETIERTAQDLQYQVNIVPKYNMISNCGIDIENTHSVSDLRLLPRRTRKLFYMKRYEIDMPLNHPRFVIPNKIYENKTNVTFMQKMLMLVESAFLHIIYGKRKRKN